MESYTAHEKYHVRPSEAFALGATLTDYRTGALPVISTGSGINMFSLGLQGDARGSGLECSNIDWSASAACIPTASQTVVDVISHV